MIGSTRTLISSVFPPLRDVVIMWEQCPTMCPKSSKNIFAISVDDVSHCCTVGNK